MDAEKIRNLAYELEHLGVWCYSRSRNDDQYAFVAAKAPRWASELRRFADALQEEELAR
jgi:hypothetical protein